MEKYNIRVVTDSYFMDGNWIENDGYWGDKEIIIADNATNKDIVRLLYNIGALYTYDLRSLSVDDDGSMITVDRRNGQPLAYLVPVC